MFVKDLLKILSQSIILQNQHCAQRIDTPRTCWGSGYSGHFGWRIECQSGRAVLEMETQKVSLHYWIANYYICATGMALYRANVEHHITMF